MNHAGWVLHVARQTEQDRNGRRRTLGTYRIFHEGVQTGLTGTSVEAKGPGDNHVPGNGHCLEAGIYTLATHAGLHYCTIGYKVDDDCDVTPKPGLELLNTGNRSAILVHPGHGFLASIGCINLTDSLPSAASDIPFVDSRTRVISAINDLRNFTGTRFPKANGTPIPNAWLIIE